MKSSFAYKLIPPRPSFPAGMTHTEAAIMQDHFVYWQKLLSQGTAVVSGPVADPAGVWGLAIVEVGTADEVRALGGCRPGRGVWHVAVRGLRHARRDRPVMSSERSAPCLT